jgi:hypothetical protein
MNGRDRNPIRPADQHVYPIDDARPHATDGSPCWCHPRVTVACTACDGHVLDCWKCDGYGCQDAGPLDRGPFVVVHERAAHE